jgi:hypothetical protein
MALPAVPTDQEVCGPVRRLAVLRLAGGLRRRVPRVRQRWSESPWTTGSQRSPPPRTDPPEVEGGVSRPAALEVEVELEEATKAEEEVEGATSLVPRSVTGVERWGTLPPTVGSLRVPAVRPEEVPQPS